MTAGLEVRAISPDGTVVWLAVPGASNIRALASALEYVGSDWTVTLTGTVFKSTKDNKITVLRTRLAKPVHPADT